ncbi:hypothetical protein SAMN05421773_11047 [Streptomyces aidingensis]|uniref:Uncharacterized protein n=2 Tax=Streptomyces aidingensis TaxID=910347 RepID=A0A1I1Q523_9ACTN|nr:hypothetical protein SAMN05421773_11047 [Streptomyces aidingensis]
MPFTPDGALDPTLGEHAKQAGMAQAEAATDPDWAATCDEAIEEMARRGQPFQASDLVRAGLVGEPDDHHRWGARFGLAARRGVIEHHHADKSGRATSRRSLLNTWIGTDTYRQQAARAEAGEGRAA